MRNGTERSAKRKYAFSHRTYHYRIYSYSAYRHIIAQLLEAIITLSDIRLEELSDIRLEKTLSDIRPGVHLVSIILYQIH